MSLSRRELLKKLGTITGAVVVLSSAALARLSNAVAESAGREVAAKPQVPKCTGIFADGGECEPNSGSQSYLCESEQGFTCQGGPLDDYECHDFSFVCDNGFTCHYSFDGCNVSDGTHTGTPGYDDCSGLFYCGNDNFNCTSGHSSS